MKLNKIQQFFNPNGEDNVRKLVIDNEVVDNTSGTWYLDDKRRKWCASLSTTGQQGFWEMQYDRLWLPEEISLTTDKQEFQELDENIKYAVENILSFLQYLDSVVPENTINLKFISGDYEIRQALGIHEFVEGGIHTKAYQYILKSLFGEDKSKIREVYYRFKNNKVLAERNLIIAQEFQELREILYKGILNTEVEVYKKAFFRSVVQDYFIENLIFFTGFLFFHLLRANMNVLSGINQQITAIKLDEQIHTILFKKLIKTFQEEESLFFGEDVIYEIAYKTAEADKKFYNETLQDKVSGLTSQNINAYIENRCNMCLISLGLKPIYKDNPENPFKTVELLNSNSNFRKSSFFEVSNVDYFSTDDIDWENQIKQLL